MVIALKHAGPEVHVTVTLRCRNGAFEFEIADDGLGMKAREAAEGFGMMSMKDRVGAVGGEVEVISASGAGTCVRGTIPVV